MDKQNMLTTPEIAALRILGYSVDSRWIEWAQNMLAEGHDTPTLRILAGELPPFDSWEMRPMVAQTLNELGVELPHNAEAAALQLARVRVQKIIDGTMSQAEALFSLADVCIGLDYDCNLHGFYRLHHALDSLNYHDHQYYWPDADRSNISEVIHSYCLDWIQKNGVA